MQPQSNDLHLTVATTCVFQPSTYPCRRTTGGEPSCYSNHLDSTLGSRAGRCTCCWARGHGDWRMQVGQDKTTGLIKIQVHGIYVSKDMAQVRFADFDVFLTDPNLWFTVDKCITMTVKTNMIYIYTIKSTTSLSEVEYFFTDDLAKTVQS